MDNQDRASDRESDRDASEEGADFGHSIASDTEYDTIFNAIEDAVFLFDVERDGDDVRFRFRWNNSSHEASTGMTTEEYHGQTPREILGEQEGAEVTANYEECVERQETIEYEERLEHSSGTVEWHTKLTPVIEEGEVEQIVGVARNITERKERERTLEHRKAHLRQAQSVANLGSWQLDLETEELHWSEEVYDLFDVSPDELLTYEQFLEFVHPEDREYVDSEWNDALDGAEYDIEYRIVTGDGEVRWIRDRADVEFDDDGTPVNALGVIQNVTERKERERELDRSKERLRRLFDEAPDGIVIHDADGNVLDVNDTLAEMLGYSPAELRSMTVPEFEIGVDEEELRERWASMDAGAMQKIAVDGTHQRSDGSTYPVEVWVSKIADDETGEDRFMALTRDVSERKKYETELRKREEKYRSLFSESRDALMLLDGDSFVECNQATLDLFGVDSPAAFSEFTPWELSPPTQPDGRDSVEAAREYIERAFNEGSAFFEWTHERPDGTEFIAEVKLSRFEVGDEQLLHALVRDVTERKERQQELERHKRFVENTNDIVTIIDSDGTIEFVSPAVERVLGWEPGELVGDDRLKYVHPDDRDDLTADIDALAERPDEEAVFEFRFQRAGGSYCWVESTARNLLDDPDVEGILLSSRDITERKEHEQQLSALHGATREFIDAESRQEVAESAVEAASELLGFGLPSVWFPDERESALELVTNSPEHQQLLDEAGTSNPAHPRDSWLWDVFESDATVVRSPLSTADLAADVPLQSAVVTSLGEHGVLGCATRGDHEFSDREVRLVETLAQNVRVALDQLEQRAALQRYRDLVENVPVGIYRNTAGDTGEFVEVNPAMVEMFDAESEAQLLDHPVQDFYAEPSQRRKFSQRLEDEDVVSEVELELETLSGEQFWGAVTAVAQATNGTTYFDGTIQDITERKEYERRLEEQRDNLEMLNQVVRHDIRNDLQVVEVYAELLEDYVEGDGEEYLETVLESAENAVDLTTTARELAAVMLQPDVENREVPVGPTVEQQIEEVRSTYSEAVVRVDGTLPSTNVIGNDMLGSVFRNLLKNAIQHNNKNVPEVAVSVDERDEHVMVRIADNGPGVPDSQKEEIFGKGEKGLESQGTGIGLYLVQSLVDGYGGDVWVEDNDPEGAVFVVVLPIVE